MRRFWVILEKRKSAREVIALLLPVAVAIAGGVWVVFTYVFPADKPAKISQPPAVSAGPGGVAAGRDISGSTINIAPSPEPPRRTEMPSTEAPASVSSPSLPPHYSPPPQPAPRPPAPTKGTLALDVTPPGAVLTLDGKQIGPAKGFHQELPAGPHDIEISADGYTAAKQTVTIFTGETLRLPLRLTLIPAPPPPPTNSQLTHMQALRKRLEQLPQGKIYLDAPTEMKVSDRRSVDARVGVNVPDDILKGHIRGGDQTVQATVRVSHEMIATLNGPGFKITRTTPEKQTVAESFPTVWQWEIEAKQDGVQELEATLYALVPNPDDASGAAQQRIDSYTQKISVSVKEQTWSEWLKSAHEGFDTVKAIVIAIGSVASVTLGWFGISLTRRSRRTPTTKRKPASRGRPQTAP